VFHASESGGLAGNEVREVLTDPRGAFSISLSPGRYAIFGQILLNGDGQSGDWVIVTVRPHSVARTRVVVIPYIP